MFGPQTGTGEKSLNFLPSFKRLLGHLAPELRVLAGVFGLALTGIAMNVTGPLLLGRATDVIFAGAIGKNLPAGTTKEQVVAQLRAEGNTTYAALVERLDLVPGQGIDFGRLASLLLIALGLYVLASMFMWLQGYLLNGAVQRSVYGLRNQVEAKINRLPLRYFDKQTRGELLSRVTNDIDNVSQALQQTLSQLLTSLLMVIGVTAMMIVVSPLLALIALFTIPVSILVTTVIGKRSQKLFMAQWKVTGELNSHIEEAFTGHSLVKVFGRQREVEATFAARNQLLFRFGVRRAVRLRPDHADDVLHREPQLRGDRGGRRAPGGQRHDEPRRRAGVHPVHPDVHPAADPGGLDGQPAAVRRGFGGAGFRGAGRGGGDGRVRRCAEPVLRAGGVRAHLVLL